MKVDVISIFPEYFTPLEVSLLGKARARGVLDVTVHDLRAWTSDVHKTVDDAPYGGGPGMVMTCGPWWDALSSVVTPTSRVVVPSPSGRPFRQPLAEQLATAEHLVFACGRYEGIDQRVLDRWATDVVSLGDYVLAGGEVATLVILEAVTRLVPGVVGNPASVQDDSFSRTDGALLEGPVYTRPAVFDGREVPAVLASGDHAAIERWRRDEALRRTAQRRPDLLAAAQLSPRDRAALDGVAE